MREVSGRIPYVVFLVVCLLISSVSVSFAQTEDTSLSATPTPIDYQLPFPGLLPDHPLYFLRQFRDDLYGVLISGSLRHAEHSLLQADKRVEASAMLVKKRKVDLAEKTLSRAIVYYEDAITRVIEAKKQGMITDEFLRRLFVANLKHKEVINALEKNYPKRFNDELKKTEEIGKKVKSLQPKR